MIDTLKLAHALRDKAGFSQESAEATAEALNDAIRRVLRPRRTSANWPASLLRSTPN
jgi:hypothetical protein